MRLDFKRKFLTHTDRVKAIDFHPSEPWILSSHYNGEVCIWNYETQTPVKKFDINDVPIRACAFIARKNWFVCGSDDFQLRVYNYNTGEKVTQFEAHPDYIRALTVHPTQPFVLTCSDDTKIKCWNWEQNWKCVQVFEGHSRYVMSLAINPKDTNTFASSCLDGSVKIWSFGSTVANFTLEAHDKGANFVSYYPAGDKPYLVTAGDDRLIKIWDYQTKACVRVLEGHTNNVSFALFHNKFPLAISGSEDGTVKIWHTLSYELVKSYNFSMERAWCISQNSENGLVTVGFDSGIIVFSLGRDEPIVSMDNSGKIVWSTYSEIQSAMIKPVANEEVTDGSSINLSPKSLGNSDTIPVKMQHSPNGRFVTVCGSDEYIVYTALAWRSKVYGKALDFAWSNDANAYATKVSDKIIKFSKNFKERPDALELDYSCDALFGGHLLGVSGADFICFYDWESKILARKIDVKPKNVYWSEDGTRVVLSCSDAFYILTFNADAFYAAAEANTIADDGAEEAFEPVFESSDVVVSGKWVGTTFIYCTGSGRLNYLVADQVFKISSVENYVYLLGYLPRDGRIYLADRDLNIISYAFNLNVVEYQTAVLDGNLEEAKSILDKIPEDEKSKLSDFLSDLGYKEAALDLSTDDEQRFELALEAGQLETAAVLARSLDDVSKWRQLGDVALNNWDFVLAEECFTKAQDHSSLLLLYTASNNVEGLEKLADAAISKQVNNTAFVCSWLTNQPDKCIEVLRSGNRLPEASFFAATYKPEAVKELLPEWKESLVTKKKERIANALDDI
ncbi:coatomer beta' subunit [Schizosaccharomyces japonicus yFS275]|uniref:Beta'-coat protein n=1 Tax=Schizosaccharomyces japonicus (strain yFS275 / FY16936) TaxID=402676 RepID=B6K5U4_SCHJY|nr:coatomer beta' subunit [Schizosaccharomyces japonicus yFS275]EEB08898.1 coatomer beta' subunit [Schizosaccharomyces japonicus yFS275]